MTKKKEATKKLVIRQVRSSISTPASHREALRGIGLRRIQHVVERVDTPALRGLTHKVSYLIEVSEK